jgi:PAS domain S-box-containing protein
MDRESHAGISGEELNAIRIEAMQFAAIGIYRYRFDGTIIFMDQGALRILDLQEKFPVADDVIGKNISDLIIYEGPKGLLRAEIIKHGHIRDYVYPFTTLTGKKRCALHDSYLAKDRNTGEDVIQVIIRDITSRKRMEEELDAERERLTVTLRSIGDGVISTDVAGRIVLLNARAEALTGWRQADAFGKALSEVFNIVNEYTRERVVSPVEKVLEHGMVVGLANHTLLIARDGTERAIADSGAPIFDRESRIIGVVLVFRDVQSERQVEEVRQRTEKLESLGLLAGGIAHDFNNYLTAILGNISLAKSELLDGKRDDDVCKMLEDAEQSSMLARGLTDQLLTFARGGAPVKKVLALPELISKCTEFTLSGSSVKLELAIAPDLWTVEADPGQFSQVMDNIVINAKQAMPEGGVLKIAADNVRLSPGQVETLEKGDYVRIRVTDHGIGIPPHHIGRLFDPYFTTKERGSGLGLATVFSIVKKHDGAIQVQSRVGYGSTFSVYLPAHKEEAAAAHVPAAPNAKRGGRILLMDDKDFVLRVCSRVLMFLGYSVECVTSGAECLEAYRRAMATGKRFDAVILDLTVPGGMGGVEALEKLREIDPGVCAVASSGYANNPVMADYRSYGFLGCITKPYTPDAVGEELARVLGGNGR